MGSVRGKTRSSRNICLFAKNVRLQIKEIRSTAIYIYIYIYSTHMWSLCFLIADYVLYVGLPWWVVLLPAGCHVKAELRDFLRHRCGNLKVPGSAWCVLQVGYSWLDCRNHWGDVVGRNQEFIRILGFDHLCVGLIQALAAKSCISWALWFQ